MSLFLGLKRLAVLVNNCNAKQLRSKEIIDKRLPAIFSNFEISKNKFHTTFIKNDLMEFFDVKENWGQKEVRVGRSWRIEELRIKSNSDLHKLWYVLLKERNMLLTMQHEYDEKYLAFPSPERIDKVKESMKNIEKVVSERNEAYHELETGETGKRPVCKAVNCFGLTYTHKMRQYPLEKKFNKAFLENEKLYNKTDDHIYIRDFLKRLDEKKRRKALYWQRRDYEKVCGIFKRFPNVDEEALRIKFPNVDIEKAKQDKLSRGHRENLY